MATEVMMFGYSFMHVVQRCFYRLYESERSRNTPRSTWKEWRTFPSSSALKVRPRVSLIP